MNAKKGIFQIIVSLSFAITTTVYICCNSSVDPKSRYNVPEGNYLFIEHHVHINGELITGEVSSGPLIDGPTYGFDSRNGVLQGRIDFPIDDNLIAIYGDGGGLSGTVGGGVATYRIMVSDLERFPTSDLARRRISAEIELAVFLASLSECRYIFCAIMHRSRSLCSAMERAISTRGLQRIHAPDAWDFSQGDTTVVIGIVNTGVDWSQSLMELN